MSGEITAFELGTLYRLLNSHSWVILLADSVTGSSENKG